MAYQPVLLPKLAAIDGDAAIPDLSSLHSTTIRLRETTAALAGTMLSLPLVVDLDGTITATDTLIESMILLFKRRPLDFFTALIVAMRGPAALKAWVAARASIDARVLPYRTDFVDFLKQEKSQGRILILATAAHHSIADSVARHLAIFDQVISTRDTLNLKGSNKLAAIKQLFGSEFVYAGDHAADLAIWREARGAILVGASRSVARRARQLTNIEAEFSGGDAEFKVWLKAFRVHQWLKNLLLFVPVLAAFSSLQLNSLVALAGAFLAFSMAASSTYIVNDLWDLENDRQHPRKCKRPFAAATLPIRQGLLASALLMTAALGLAALVAKPFLLFLLGYVAVTTAYSFVLKSYMLLDVLVLSLLYTLRILAGAAAINLSTSHWLLAFSMFVFLSLALVKRCSELVALRDSAGSSSPGRDYHVQDLTVLLPTGLATTACSIVVFGLFIQSPETQGRYMTPELLWTTAFLLTYWLFRLWIKTTRGEMHDDPVVYAVSNPGSLMTVCGVGATMVCARFICLAEIL